MLSFFTILSFTYLLVWVLLLPRLTAHVRSFDPAKGTRKGDKVLFPLNSHEGRVITVLGYGTLLMFGAIGTLALCLFIGFFWGF